MSGLICTCDSPVKHLGLPNCSDNIGIPKRLIFVPTYQQDGTLNYIDTVSDAIDTQAFWDGLQYNTDSSARHFPLPADIESVETAKGDTVYQEFPSGRKVKVRDGVRSFKGFYPQAAAPLIDKLESKGCAKHSVYIIDNYGNLIGVEKSLGKLYPLQIADNSLDSMFQFATDTTVPGIPVMFEFAQNVKDSQISFIKASDIAIDLFTQYSGKIDANIVQVGTGTATSFVVDIYTDYGDAKDKIPVEGLVAADFTLFNITDNGSVSISTCVESTTVPGRYTFTFTSQTTTDLLRLGLSTSTAAKPYDGGTWADYIINLD